MQADGAGNGRELDRVFRQVMALEGDGDAVGDERGEFEEGSVFMAGAMAELAGLEHLLDGAEQAVGVGEHDVVEVLPLRLGDLAALQGFEVEADGSDRRLQLVGDGVEEGLLTLVAADLAHEEDGVEDDAGDEDSKEDETENEHCDALLCQDDPGYVEGDQAADDEHPKGDRKGGESASSGEVHGVELSIVVLLGRIERWTVEIG